jgi:DNA polymerase epsilon subunit 2
MGEPVHTPRPPGPVPLFQRPHTSKDPIPSSSPAFGTPAYPIASKPVKLAQPFAVPAAQQPTSTVLPILLPPQTLRPLAFRTLTKKHNLTLTSSALQCLATFIGRHCGSGWREEGLAERVLDEVAKSWKRASGGVIVEDGPDKKLTNILKFLEPCISGGRLDLGRSTRSSSTNNLSRQDSLSLPNGGAPSKDSQTSLGLSTLDVDDNDDSIQPSDPDLPPSASVRTFLKVISAQSQPRLSYSTTKKSLETITTPASLLPPVSHKTAMFRNRYNLVHQRLLRNELFQTPSFSTTTGRTGSTTLHRSVSNAATVQQAYRLTPIANLLGRSGSEHLLLAMLVNTPTGDLALTDLTGSVCLDLSDARPEREDGAWYCPGMIVLVVGVYDEDAGADSSTGGGVGGMIGGRFVATSIAGPPAERRDITLGLGSGKADHVHTSVGAGFGWVDFLGVGSEKGFGAQMRRLQRRVLGQNSNANSTSTNEAGNAPRTKIALLGECTLDNPRTLEAVRGVLASYNASGDLQDIPLSFVLMGNFTSTAAMAGATTTGGGSIEYKEQFDALAAVLAEFPAILSSTTFVFVPGDNDPWSSSFSGGAATAVPREAIPELFSSRIRRAVATADQERGRKEGENGGEAVWVSNPARISLFGPVEEIVLFRDDITGRLRRGAVMFSKSENGEIEQDDIEMDGNDQEHTKGDQEGEPMEIDIVMQEASSRIPTKPSSKSTAAADTNIHTARKLVKTILDQGYLSPFPLATRPVFWDYSSSLSLYPLPTALVLADAQAPAFAVKYEGCLVMNPGRVVDELGARKGIAKWVEYDVKTRRGIVREHRF